MWAAVSTAAALALAGCTGATGPDGSAAPKPANDFCSAMLALTAAAPPANTALNDLLTSMNNPDIFLPGASLESVNTAGQAVVDNGGAYATAIEGAKQWGDDSLSADFTAMRDFWTVYAVPLGQVAVDSTTYDALIAGARPLIESSTTADLTTAEAAAADRVAVAYKDACSSS